jgi:hypothetical protein
MDHVQAVERVCTYYLSALAVANGRIVRSGAAMPPPPGDAQQVETPALESRADALNWLENERANVLACFRKANSLSLARLIDPGELARYVINGTSKNS